MSETALRQTSHGQDGVKITFAGKTTTRAGFDPKAFAGAIKRSRRRPGGKSIAEREAIQAALEAKVGKS
jgi:hypothetical protein